MSMLSDSGGFRFSDGVIRGIERGDVLATGMELLGMNAGFRVLPVDPDTKAPFPYLTPRGVLDATTDSVSLRQWFALAPDAGLGTVPGSGFAILDDDTGQLDVDAYGLLGTFVERTRRGMHFWTRLAGSRHLRKTKLFGGDLITGDRAYAVMSPTPPYVPIDSRAPILTLPPDSPLWDLPAPASMLEATIVPSSDDQEEARLLNRRIRDHAQYREGFAALFGQKWRTTIPNVSDRSESGRDFWFVFIATHFVREHPRAAEILYALLWDTGWPNDANRDHTKSDPVDYCRRTVLAALDARHGRDTDRLFQLATRHIFPFSPGLRADSPLPFAGTVLDANQGSRMEELETVILRFAASNGPDEYTCVDRWRRFPVVDVATVFGLSRETVRQWMVALERRGLIDRFSTPYRWEGQIRRDTRIRIVNSYG